MNKKVIIVIIIVMTLLVSSCDKEKKVVDKCSIPYDKREEEKCGIDSILDSDISVRIIRVKGKLYYETKERVRSIKCGVMDGNVNSKVARNKVPFKDNQSNFRDDLGYISWKRFSILVPIDNELIVFKSKEALINKIVRVKGRLYYDTGEIARVECGTMNGEIRSRVGKGSIPKKDEQSNFSDELAYQFEGEKRLNVRYKGVYYIFRAEE